MPEADTGSLETGDYMIILGEGDPVLRRDITIALFGVGFNVMPCEDGMEVIRHALRYPHPHDSLVVVSESALPAIPGHEACRRIRSFGPDYRDITMFGMSGNPDDETLWSGMILPGTFIDRSGPDPAMTVSGGVIRNLIYINACRAGETMIFGHSRYG